MWGEPKEVFNPDCFLKTAKQGEGSVMILVSISYKSAGPVVSLYCRINIQAYLRISSDQIHPIVSCPERKTIFQNDNIPDHKILVKEWTEKF